MNSIPASLLADVIPGVVGTGGNPLSLNAVFVDNSGDTSIPVGTVQPFTSAAAVSAWYGPGSPQALLANVYFGGFTNCTVLPSTLWFTQYNAAAVAAYVRGGSLAALTLAQLQVLTGTLILTVNGEVVTTGSINLSSATSFSNAASIITTALDTGGGIFSGTGTISGTTLTISAVASGALHVGDVVTGSGVTANTTVSAFLGGTGGTGTYTVSISQTVGSPTALTVTSSATCTWDTLRSGFVITSPTTGSGSTIGFASGTLAASLDLTSATGAVTSQGAAAASAAGIMNGVAAAQQNWATFMTVSEPILSLKLAFAAWVTAQNQRYGYVCFDSDVTARSANATGSFGVLTEADTGVIPVWNPSGLIAAFICGTVASINFNQRNGRITFAFRGQSGLVADITDQTTYQNLISNGYNCYASFATAQQQFLQLQNGQISGNWKWIDPYINQIWLNSNLQLALVELLQQALSVPYNVQGYGLIHAACLDPITQAVNFGAIRSGVVLSSAQIAEVNQAAGIAIDGVLYQSGWYLQILDPGSIVRGNRGSPVCTLWYTDGDAVQQINLGSIDVM